MRLAHFAASIGDEPRRAGPATCLLACLALSSAGIAACSDRVGNIDDNTSNVGGGDGGQGNVTPGPCVGVDPGDDARTDPEESAKSGGEDAAEVPTTIPLWRLRDFQRQSCGYEATYGADSFEGNVVVMAMLQGWCGYCQNQALNLDRMRIEFSTLGYDNVVFMAINGTSADNDEDRGKLLSKCAFPLFQDLEAINAWQLHAGKKDDIFIYDAEGKLAKSFQNFEETNTDLSTVDGYAAIKNAILELVAP